MSKILNKLLLFLILFNLSISEDQSPPPTHNELTCGKEDSPKKPKDCTEYGTGSGFVCCWISDSPNSNGRCRLVPDSVAREHGIKGTKTFRSSTTEEYWDCGNDAGFIFFRFVNIVLFLIFL